MNFVSRQTTLARLLTSRKFRDSYVLENIKRIIPFQVRTMRDEREWSQAKAAMELGKKQSGYSRLESPTYGKLTVQTLLEIARGFDVGLLIKFVPFSRLVREYNDVSLPALSARSVTEKEEVQALEKWANEEPTPTQIFVDTSVFLNLLPHQVTTWEPILIRGTERDVETPTQRGLYPAAVPAGHSKLDPAVGRTITPLSRGHSTGEGAGYRSMVNG